MARGPLIAVDGPAASGKGTIARALARHFNIPHLDTGALYRAVALRALRERVDPADSPGLARIAAALDLSLLEDPALRDDRTAEAASRISAVPGVRAALLDFQRAFASQPGGAVLDGRDIGTVIAPGADAKLFVIAPAEVRARRRFVELARGGAAPDEAAVLADIRARDARDSGRAEAPLRQAPDAVLLDTGNLGIEEAIRQAVDIVSKRLDRSA